MILIISILLTIFSIYCFYKTRDGMSWSIILPMMLISCIPIVNLVTAVLGLGALIDDAEFERKHGKNIKTRKF